MDFEEKVKAIVKDSPRLTSWQWLEFLLIEYYMSYLIILRLVQVKYMTNKTANAANESLTLSAAILSPINSLFEAQVHSARAFLNFILQMGFGDTVSESELAEEQERIEQLLNNSEDMEVDERQDLEQKRTRVTYLQNLLAQYTEYLDLKKKKDSGAELTAYEESRLDELKALDGEFENANLKEDIHTLKFKYQDGSGNTHTIIMPALALIPIQPLGITKATFDFNLAISRHTSNFNQHQPSRRGSPKRPWFFIQPKRIEGSIHSESSMQSQRGIKIHVEVASTPIPQGLSNLLTSLTQSGRIEHKQD